MSRMDKAGLGLVIVTAAFIAVAIAGELLMRSTLGVSWLMGGYV